MSAVAKFSKAGLGHALGVSSSSTVSQSSVVFSPVAHVIIFNMGDE